MRAAQHITSFRDRRRRSAYYTRDPAGCLAVLSLKVGPAQKLSGNTTVSGASLVKAAPEGNPGEAMWLPDEAAATAWLTYHRTGKPPTGAPGSQPAVSTSRRAP